MGSSVTESDPARQRPSWKGLAAILLLTFCVGVVPIWQWLDVQGPPDGVRSSQVEVLERDRSSDQGIRRSRNGQFLTFEVDGARQEAFLNRRTGGPDVGETIEVWRADGRWQTPAVRSIWTLVLGLVGTPIGLVLIAGWIKARRRAAPSA